MPLLNQQRDGTAPSVFATVTRPQHFHRLLGLLALQPSPSTPRINYCLCECCYTAICGAQQHTPTATPVQQGIHANETAVLSGMRPLNTTTQHDHNTTTPPSPSSCSNSQSTCLFHYMFCSRRSTAALTLPPVACRARMLLSWSKNPMSCSTTHSNNSGVSYNKLAVHTHIYATQSSRSLPSPPSTQPIRTLPSPYQHGKTHLQLLYL